MTRIGIVTGGSTGIGAAIVDALRRDGITVASLDLRPRADSPSDVLHVECDVADEDQVLSSVALVESSLGAPTVVVNNAGVLARASFADTTVEEWNRVLATNLTSAFVLTHRLVPGMVDEGFGRVINIGSSAGKNGGVNTAGAYAVSKAGLMCHAKSIAVTYGRAGITGNVVSPSMIGTGMLDMLDADAIGSRIPVGRLGTPADVSSVVAFLASDQSGYINGEVIDVDGGLFID